MALEQLAAMVVEWWSHQEMYSKVFIVGMLPFALLSVRFAPVMGKAALSFIYGDDASKLETEQEHAVEI